MEHIKIENLTFRYNGSDRPALDGMSLSVNEGELVCIIGKSGSGKTTLLRCLKPLVRPGGAIDGNIHINGKNINELSAKEQAAGIGFVFQSPEEQLITDKVWHEIAFTLENIGMPKTQMRIRLAETAEYFGFGSRLGENVADMSGGEKQMLCLASAMATAPTLLLLDEPFSRLDPESAEKLAAILKKINRELGVTVIITAHRLDGLLDICDRFVLTENGKIVTACKPKTLFSVLSDAGYEDMLPCYAKLTYKDGTNAVTAAEGKKLFSELYNGKTISDNPIPNTKPAVMLRNVCFRYEKNSPDILKQLTFLVSCGSVCAVVGANGCGKSTAAKLMSGILRPYSGKAVLNGKVSYLPQQPSLIFIKESLREELNGASSDLITLFGLEELLGRHPNDLSGGETVRAAMAKLLLSDPDILILDEPTQGVDSDFSKALSAILKKLTANGKTVVVFTHDIEFAAECADSAAMMSDGEVTAFGSVREVFCNNVFYTTCASRISRGTADDVLTGEDIIRLCEEKTQ